MKKVLNLILLFTVISIFSACSTTRKKKEVKGFKKFYHNTTAKFNGYFNAEELMKESMVTLQGLHVDNYNSVLSIYDYTEVDNPQSIKADMDKAIEKLSTVATIHDVSNYVDDCYMLIGKAQFMKQDYIAAEETFLYFEEVFDPKNPYGKAYDSKAYKSSSSSRKSKKEIKEERKEKEAEREEKKKIKEEERKEKEDIRKEKEKERKEAQKQRKKESKQRKKNRSKSRSSKKTKEDKTKKVEEKKVVEKKELTPEQIAMAEAKALENEIAAEEAGRRKDIEDARKKKKEKEDEKYKNQGEGAIFKNKSAYTEGLYWLARTYVETERFAAAEYAFKRLDDTPGLKSSVESKIPAAKAHLYIKTKDFERALLELDDAIELEGNRNKRARYAFIKAQLYELQGNTSQAYDEYKKAKKFSTRYELDLNASLNELKLSYRTGKTSYKKALTKLEGYLNDKKNNEFADQIYFAMASIKLDSDDLEGAKEDFASAISSTGGNKNVKLEAYYKLAELLFNQGFYSESKDNYDNALKVMKKSDSRYKQVERLSKNLTDIADNINVVELQDSLLALSNMDEDKLRDLAIEKVKENKVKASEQTDQGPSNRKSNIISSNRQLGSGRSNFFAYNPITLNQGKVEFKRTWGDRVLEDNWRRSLRSNANQETENIFEDNKEEDSEAVTEEEIREILRNIPRNDNQLASSNIKIQNALFQLGILFRERIRNYKKSIQVLERLEAEYPNFEKRDEALFYLYLSYLDSNLQSLANNIKDKLRNEFPDSKFTKLATDPSYALALKEKEDNIEKYYESTYELFNKGEYQVVLDRISDKDKLYNKTKKYAAKFSLLNAMSLGSIKGKNDYIQSLEQVIRSHPNTPEETRAKEILRFLKGDQDAFNDILFDEAVQVFEPDAEKLHYMFVVTYNLDQKAFDKAKLDILNYNKKFHRFENLKLSNIYLNQENKARIILVRSFDNKDNSMKYYEGVQKNKDLFIKDLEIGYDMFPTTQRNYREVIKQKTVSNYRAFFEKNYLEDNK